MHGIDQHADMGGIDVRGDAMAEVEHVSGAVTEAGQRLPNGLADRLGSCRKGGRIQIALQGDPMTHARTCFGQADGPVDAERIATAVGEALKMSIGALGEQDQRNIAGRRVRLERLRDHAQIALRKLDELFCGKHATPGIEHHQRLRTGGSLRGKIGDDGARIDIEQVMQG